jgi:multisubunit Na+/H+ antiporter MnhB subunit
MSARAVRRVVVAVFVLGVAGIIAFSISDDPDAALASGLLTAAAAIVLIAVTAVTTPRRTADPEALAERLEDRVSALVAAGADEAEVRRLVRDAVSFGRTRPGS